MAPKRKKPTTERRRAPFDYADTDWGKEWERRHNENIERLDRGDKRFGEIELRLAENTQITTSIKTVLDEHIVPVITELHPIVMGVKAAKKGGRLAWAGSIVAGRVYKVAAIIGGSFGFVMAVLHRESIGEAVAAFWRAFK